MVGNIQIFVHKVMRLQYNMGWMFDMWVHLYSSTTLAKALKCCQSGYLLERTFAIPLMAGAQLSG